MGMDARTLPLIVIPGRHADNRGWLSEIFHEQRLRELGIVHRFIQDNQSSSKRAGTVRGLHFQRPPATQAKLVRVLHGRVLDIAVDIRRGSPTFARHVSIELSAEDGQQLYIPEGFAHGFVTLDDNVCVMYRMSSYYSPAHESGIRWDDPDIAFPWPFKTDELTISEKDARLPYLKYLESPFAYDGSPLTELKVCQLG